MSVRALLLGRWIQTLLLCEVCIQLSSKRPHTMISFLSPATAHNCQSSMTTADDGLDPSWHSPFADTSSKVNCGSVSALHPASVDPRARFDFARDGT